jgi:hypothetical protein
LNHLRPALRQCSAGRSAFQRRATIGRGRYNRLVFRALVNRPMSDSQLFYEELNQPRPAIGYRISKRLAELRPNATVLEACDEEFELQRFAAAGFCHVDLRPGMHHEIQTHWDGPGEGSSERALNAWFEVVWQGKRLEVVSVTYRDAFGGTTFQWIVADEPETARTFLIAVCEWCHELRGEILVFAGGCWQKSTRLFQAIRTADYEGLVLGGSLKQEILRDLEEFLASRSVYEEYGVPWKRGILFLGPPGNGKTYCVKALINRLRRPCLYVQSFKSRYETEHAGIKNVFERARSSAPCLLVLEDLDSLITPENRSFFLNELDGFAENRGIITLATTNHPEKLDPSIVDRPSRFDMKYHFELPAANERREYLAVWNGRLHAQMQLTSVEIDQAAGWTEGFSFAYLKELILSSITRWIRGSRQGSVAGVMESQVGLLREQMTIEPAPPAVDVDLDEE